MKKVVSICLIIFGMFLSSLTYWGIEEFIGIQNSTNSNVSSSTVESEYQFTNNYGHEYINKVKKTYYGYNTEVKTDELVGIKGYVSNGNEVSFDNISSSKIYEQVFSNGKDVASKYFYGSDMSVDTLLLGDNIIDYAYDENGSLYSIIVNDTIFSCEYDEFGRVIKSYVNDDVEHEYEYNSLGFINKETDYKGIITSYSYSDSKLEGSEDIDAFIIGDSVKYNLNGKEYEYVFDYTYEDKKLCTSIIENGLVIYEFNYLNDKITSIKVDGFELDYILDSNLDYIGLSLNNNNIYYFIKDFFGNVYAIIDELGNPVVYYNHKAYGEVDVDGVMASNLGAWNVIVNNRYITYSENNVQLGNGEVIFSNEKQKITFEKEKEQLLFTDSIYYQNIDLTRDEMGIHTAVKGKVMENALDNFKYEGMEMATSVPVLNKNKEYIDTVDLYVIDYAYTSNSFSNLINGNQIYNIVYRDASTSSVDDEVKVVNDIIKNEYKLDYYEEVTPVIGKLVFEGQFIYFDRLVKYNCNGDGVIYYHFEKNETNNYSPYINLYDYDNSKYVNYVNSTFNIDLWDYVEIIPGMNQEKYEVLKGYIDDSLKVAMEVSQENFTYFDETYFDSIVESSNGDTLAAFDNISKDDMVVMSEDGDFVIKAIPWNESREFRTAAIITTTTVVVLTLVTVISCVVPGGQILIPVVSAAWNTMFTSMLFSLAIPTIKLAGDLADGDLDMDLNQFLKTTSIDFFNSITAGIISGAFFGALGQFKNSLLNKSINRKLEKVNSVYDNALLTDSSAAYNEYIDLVASINTGKSSFLHRYLGSKHDIKIVKKLLKKVIKKELERE